MTISDEARQAAKDIKASWATHEEVATRIQQAINKINAELQEYADHKPECRIRIQAALDMPRTKRFHDCDCGLAQLLEKLQ